MDVYEQQQVSEDVVPDLADAMAELEMSETEKDKKDQQNVSEFFIYLLIIYKSCHTNFQNLGSLDKALLHEIKKLLKLRY